MGVNISSTVYGQLAESCLDKLQGDALRNFASKRIDFSLREWNSSTVYGYAHGRNKSFETTRNALIVKLKAGFKAAHYSVTDMSGFMEDYIQCSLAHHVMKCLLESDVEKNVAEIPIDLSAIASKRSFHKLPEYDRAAIAAFQKRWTKIDDSHSIALDTKNDTEKSFLSARLAQNVFDILDKIDVPALVADAIETYNTAQIKAKASEAGFFAQSSADGAGMLAARVPMVDPEVADIEARLTSLHK